LGLFCGFLATYILVDQKWHFGYNTCMLTKQEKKMRKAKAVPAVVTSTPLDFATLPTLKFYSAAGSHIGTIELTRFSMDLPRDGTCFEMKYHGAGPAGSYVHKSVAYWGTRTVEELANAVADLHKMHEEHKANYDRYAAEAVAERAAILD
jgi:hypothetical protein